MPSPGDRIGEPQSDDEPGLQWANAVQFAQCRMWLGGTAFIVVDYEPFALEDLGERIHLVANTARLDGNVPAGVIQVDRARVCRDYAGPQALPSGAQLTWRLHCQPLSQVLMSPLDCV